MKSIKVLLFIAFSVLCLSNTSLLAVNSKVDSVYNAIKGTWYKAYNVSGMTGDRDSVYTKDSTVISRISATDSISWKEYRNGLLVSDFHYQIAYLKSLIFQTDKWMLTSGDMRILVSAENFGFSYRLDAYDGGGAGYSPSADLNVDFIYNAIKGTWYKVLNYSGMTGYWQSIYTSDSTVITRIPGTDSIAWKEYTNGLLTNEYRFLIAYSQSFLYQSRQWMLAGGSNGLLITLNDYGFSYLIDAIDAGGLGYSHTKNIKGVSDKTVNGENIRIIQNQNNSITVIGNSTLQKVELFDLFGRKQASWRNVEPGQALDVSDLKSGIYLVIIKAGNTNFEFKIVF